MVLCAGAEVVSPAAISQRTGEQHVCRVNHGSKITRVDYTNGFDEGDEAPIKHCLVDLQKVDSTSRAPPLGVVPGDYRLHFVRYVLGCGRRRVVRHSSCLTGRWWCSNYEGTERHVDNVIKTDIRRGQRHLFAVIDRTPSPQLAYFEKI
jgi:hypothetical protein